MRRLPGLRVSEGDETLIVRAAASPSGQLLRQSGKHVSFGKRTLAASRSFRLTPVMNSYTRLVDAGFVAGKPSWNCAQLGK
jgi:hypothetical protein